ncbi:hypothetical protein SPRG_04847 [Saprolegnia parasitica CBS 223.65]|uniref:Uncharacterized protein n=1 Tax=Saprolegnia parasitica (strain CBS 223.65) TaxID=695850 RepID=A0A067CKM3_SAPPC|nr:hypothetical protein SPRG_04847 [Saprolegnia parasitica CBS 223.65]KDO29730.1 hypothetical protein SPRG_04847 [Saprolegnia parasitica CBS 223.65]|eukprot:XP_012199379.1 hypothetical protein SPRG_04847 [Saprolegnia parasitica CBS 223.65]
MASLGGKHVTSGYVDHEANLGKDELVARAKASVKDHKALYRALEVRHKLIEIVSPISYHHYRQAGGIAQFDIYDVRPMLFAPSCRVDPTSNTWGRDDLVQIFNNDEIEFRDNGSGVPNGVGWHWYNASEDQSIDCSLQDECSYGEHHNEISDNWRAFMAAHGLHINAFRSWRAYAHKALVQNSDAHRAFCSDVIKPLRAHLTAHLSDVKFVTCAYCDDCDQVTSTSFLGGVSPDGYLSLTLPAVLVEHNGFFLFHFVSEHLHGFLEALCLTPAAADQPFLHTNYLAFCPTLYHEDVFEKNGMSYLHPLCSRRITNSYVDNHLYREELAACAKASVMDHKALYRALVVRRKLTEIIARTLRTCKRPPADWVGHIKGI